MPTLCYWNLRGVVNAIRYLLHYVEEEYEDKKYILDGADMAGSREIWLKDKFNLGLDFPNLPYYMDADVKLTQSMAIIRYIGAKYKLMGSTLKESAEIDMALMEAFDSRVELAKLSYNEKFEELKKGAIEAHKEKMKNFSKKLGGKEFLCGKISVADFMLYEALYCWRELDRELVSEHSNLDTYIKRFEAIPQINAFMKSDSFIQGPMHAPVAAFNGKWKKP